MLPWAFRTIFWLAGQDIGGLDGTPSDTDACLPPEPANENLVLRLEGFEGPMDLLLDLARAQKVDLAKISILSLVDQYLAVIEGARRIRLELAADWLVMAAWLTWLKSRLLVPAAANDDLEDGLMAAEALADAAAGDERHPHPGGLAGGAAGARPGRVRPRRAATPRGFDRSRIVLEPGPFVRAYLEAIRRGTSRRPTCRVR